MKKIEKNVEEIVKPIEVNQFDKLTFPKVDLAKKPTNNEIFGMYKDLVELKHVPGIDANTAISKTIVSIKPYYERYTFENIAQKTEDFEAYEKELEDAYKKLATPKGETEPRYRTTMRDDREMRQFDIDFNSDEVQKIRSEIEVKYAATIKERQEQVRQFYKWMDMECKFPIVLEKVKLSWMPKNKEANLKPLFDAVFFILDYDVNDTPETKKGKN